MAKSVAPKTPKKTIDPEQARRMVEIAAHVGWIVASVPKMVDRGRPSFVESDEDFVRWADGWELALENAARALYGLRRSSVEDLRYHLTDGVRFHGVVLARNPHDMKARALAGAVAIANRMWTFDKTLGKKLLEHLDALTDDLPGSPATRGRPAGPPIPQPTVHVWPPLRGGDNRPQPAPVGCRVSVHFNVPGPDGGTAYLYPNGIARRVLPDDLTGTERAALVHRLQRAAGLWPALPK